MGESLKKRAGRRSGDGSGRARRRRGGAEVADSEPRPPESVAGAPPASTMRIAHAGQWIEAEELRQRVMVFLRDDPDPAGKPSAGVAAKLDNSSNLALDLTLDLTLDLSGVDHLDASALQILLALEAEQRRRGRRLHLVHPSEPLRQWFEYAGAAELLSLRAQAAPQSTPQEEPANCEKC
jgi:anti-anti-sigma regulatory factor